MNNQHFSRDIAANREIPACAGMTMVALISTRRKPKKTGQPFFDSLQGRGEVEAKSGT
jgi:hypothetical protein